MPWSVYARNSHWHHGNCMNRSRTVYSFCFGVWSLCVLVPLKTSFVSIGCRMTGEIPKKKREITSRKADGLIFMPWFRNMHYYWFTLHFCKHQGALQNHTLQPLFPLYHEKNMQKGRIYVNRSAVVKSQKLYQIILLTTVSTQKNVRGKSQKFTNTLQVYAYRKSDIFIFWASTQHSFITHEDPNFFLL